ncbi:helix-turn-helix transcriptional regulator [uncultured Dubosiella sp.]|uniref:helix-turn-helix domain-containing protein n=2 Tax=uncultured Dubosiella sp. TaxID=1937011 RepID=UPI00207F11E3|nr:helix-turn-helix transcriptional regulator [uncultured Dubosiella sp.]GJM58938.1 hypothetical protein EROP_26310 [Erysipelotrichaceae bacterium OPF54]
MKERLKELLEERGISYQKLSNETGVSTNTIFKIIKGKSESISTDTLIKLCKFFNVSTDYFLGLSDIRSTDYENADLAQELGLSVSAVQNITSLNTEVEKGKFISEKMALDNLLQNKNKLIRFLEYFSYMIAEKSHTSEVILMFQAENDVIIPPSQGRLIYRKYIEEELTDTLISIARTCPVTKQMLITKIKLLKQEREQLKQNEKGRAKDNEAFFILSKLSRLKNELKELEFENEFDKLDFEQQLRLNDLL